MITRRGFLQAAGASLAGLLAGCEMEGDTAVTNERVLIIGAGMAGLAAGQTLRQAGYAVTLLEARDRLGGRVWTDRAWPDVPLDMGASWIHGVDGNPITALAEQFGAATKRTDYDSVTVFDANGSRLSGRELAELDEYAEELYAVLAQAQAERDRDVSLQTVIDQAAAAEALSQEEMLRLNYVVNATIEQEYAADSAELSLFEFDQDEAFPGEDVLFPGGYDQIVNGLAQGLDARTLHVVEKVEYGDTAVNVQTNQGEFTAERAIVTVPLGVLQKRRIQFDPALPAQKTAAINSLGMGLLHKTYLRFPEPFWDKRKHFIERIPVKKGVWGEFLNMYRYIQEPVLVGFNAGSYGRYLETLGDEEIVAGAMAALRGMYGHDIPDPEAWRISRWGLDPYSYGSYSFMPVGVTGEAYDWLAEPVNGRLFFAGEATHRTYPATVHGAFLSGRRAARQIAALAD
ncbi:MAG TPA: FAD-binding protein [Anaerolineae bacterium]|nr:FAD-binding protein [Anaerolineae bacterium]